MRSIGACKNTGSQSLSRLSMLPGSHQVARKLTRTRLPSHAPLTFASRLFRPRIRPPRSTKNAHSTSTPAPPRSGSATSTDPCLSFLALIINNLPLCSVPPFPSVSLEPLLAFHGRVKVYPRYSAWCVLSRTATDELGSPRLYRLHCRPRIRS